MDANGWASVHAGEYKNAGQKTSVKLALGVGLSPTLIITHTDSQ
ncbi:MAG TPA: hypothetical protein VFI68_05430 [Anaerolineales bacterium]|nr:hypothetical protein [Anaerolineales bacterium]